MTSMRRRALVRATALAVLSLPLLAACAGQEAAAGPRVVEAHAYKVDSDIDSAIRFFDNRNVFEGTVVSTGEAVLARDIMESGTTFEAVYTPVVMKVGEVYQGLLKPGELVTVRAMGGEAGGLRYEIHEAPAKETFREGGTLVIFGGDLSKVDSEVVAAITPNFVYQLKGREFVDASYTDEAMDGAARFRVGDTTIRERLRALS